VAAPALRDYLSYGPRDDVVNDWDAAGNLRARIDTSTVGLGLGATTTNQPGNTAPAVNDGTTNVMAVNGSTTNHRYRADGRLMQTQRDAGCVLWIDDTNNTAYCTNQVPDYLRQDRTESYRYDALGRRVYVRTETPTGGWGACAWRCDNTVRRTIWDGDQVLAEIRYPAEVADQDSGMDPANLQALAQKAQTDTTPHGHPYGGPNTSDWAQHGRVLYVHAGGIDQPLALIRMDYSFDFPGPTLVVPHANWRGAYELATFLGGGRTNCTGVWMPADEVVRMDSTGHMVFPADGSTADVYQTRCVEIDFPGKYMGMTRLLQRQTVAGPVSWMGSLVQDNQDASGLMYRRNRLYDPKSGRFTQEDPIGLAGGVNAYGFAAGDPVSYDDPYGLSAQLDDCPPKCTDEPGQGISMYAWWQMLSPETRQTIKVLIFGGACGHNNLRCAVSPIVPGGGAIRGALAVEMETAEISGILRAAGRGKGNFGVGEATADQANAAGRAWVGEGYTVASDGKTLVSRDQLRQYRPPSYKPKLGREQANLESREVPRGQWQSNGHIDIKP
jgi:RHS repeat-associated protein